MAAAFKDSVVWITGASSGIGRQLALEFADRGAVLAVSARRADRLEELVAELTERGARASAVPCDVTDETQVEAAVAEIVKQFGKLDVAVANAGFGVAGSIVDMTADDWRRQLDTNVVGAAMTARYALPELTKTQGRLALVGSIMAMMTMAKNGPYAASKYAVRAMGQTLAQELHGTGVSVTTIHPGLVHSDIARVNNQGVYEAGRKETRPQRFMWPTERAARVMADAIYRRKREFTFTGHGKMLAFLGRHLPGFVHFAMTRGAGKKAAAEQSRAAQQA
jgi:NAD(P)-dependent dehydrogenase (short-subunit alcohol dehydrogenase family)